MIKSFWKQQIIFIISNWKNRGLTFQNRGVGGFSGAKKPPIGVQTLPRVKIGKNLFLSKFDGLLATLAQIMTCHFRNMIRIHRYPKKEVKIPISGQVIWLGFPTLKIIQIFQKTAKLWYWSGQKHGFPTRDRATRGSEQRGCSKVPRVWVHFGDFWCFEWVFLALGATSSPTRKVGVFGVEWEILRILFERNLFPCLQGESLFFGHFACSFFHSRRQQISKKSDILREKRDAPSI